MICRILMVTLYLFSFPSYGSEVLDSLLKAAIEKSLPNFEIYSVAVGVLTDDNDQYAAALLNKPIENEQDKEMLIAVFRRMEDQSYHLVAKSLRQTYYPLSSQGWSELRIEKQAIFFSYGGSSGCCSGLTTEFRFKKSALGVVLVGAEIKSYGYEENSDPEQYYEARKSINFLTGKVIHSKRIGVGKENTDELGFGGKTQYREIALAFDNSRTLDLANYPAGYFDIVDKNSNLCGFINEKRRYVPCKH